MLLKYILILQISIDMQSALLTSSASITYTHKSYNPFISFTEHTTNMQYKRQKSQLLSARSEVHAYSCQHKKEQVLTISEVVTPGISDVGMGSVPRLSLPVSYQCALLSGKFEANYVQLGIQKG